MKNSILVIGFAALLCAGCTKTGETPSGLKYTYLRSGSGEVGKPKEILLMTMTYKDNKDSIWTDTRKEDFPFMMQIQDSVPKGKSVFEVFQLLKKGDSVTFQIKAKELFEKTFQSPVPPKVDSTGMFTFNIGAIALITEDSAKSLQTAYMAKQNEKAELEKLAQLAKDTVIIDAYLADKGIVAQKTASGLRYVVEKEGKGEQVKVGETVKVDYAGYLLDGTYFDSSIEAVAKANNAVNANRPAYEPLQLTIGYREVVAGWEEMLSLMKKGEKVTVYIPSPLGFGAQRRSEVIGENAILMFNMELIDIIKK